MIYTLEKAILITDQLKKFKDAYAYQLAGHFGNINFWLNEVKSAFCAMDEYNKRFITMSNARIQFYENHGEPIHEYCSICNGRCEFSNGIPNPPKRIVNSEIKEVRKNLLDACYYFLIRGYNAKIISKTELKNYCDIVDISIDPNDLKE